jgi:hypothetical protein
MHEYALRPLPLKDDQKGKEKKRRLTGDFCPQYMVGPHNMEGNITIKTGLRVFPKDGLRDI